MNSISKTVVLMVFVFALMSVKVSKAGLASGIVGGYIGASLSGSGKHEIPTHNSLDDIVFRIEKVVDQDGSYLVKEDLFGSYAQWEQANLFIRSDGYRVVDGSKNAVDGCGTNVPDPCTFMVYSAGKKR